MRGPRKQSGFTLVELLVVMVIVSLLAMLLLPALATARNAARAVCCLNNQRQLYPCVLIYVDESEGCLPPYPQTNLAWYGLPILQAARQLHITNFSRSVVACPCDTGSSLSLMDYGTGPWDGNKFYYSYTQNGYAFNLCSGGWALYRLREIQRPSQTFLFADGFRNAVTFSDIWRQFFLVRHARGINLSFADGSAHFVELGLPHNARCTDETPKPFTGDSGKFPWR